MTFRSISANPNLNRGFWGGINNSWNNNQNFRVSRPSSFPTIHNTSSSIRIAGNRLMEALRGFTSGSFATFPPMVSSSTASNVATGAVDHSVRNVNHLSQSLTINVHQLARAQVNQGDAMSSTDRAVDTGRFTVGIFNGETNHEFEIHVRAGDTNETIQRRLADAINESNIGIRATISAGTNATDRNPAYRTTRLTLTAAQTGTESAFTVTDISGNLAQALGIREVTETAQNAIFSIRPGRVEESQSNNISIGRGISVNLQGVGQAQISFGRDTERADTMVRNIVGAINNILNLPTSGSGVRGEDRLVRDMRGALQTFSADLARVGIHVRRNGEITINENALRGAIQAGTIGDLFGSDSPFMNRIGRIAHQAANTNRFTNAPIPVEINRPFNLFDFGNAFTHWSFINMMG